MDTSETMKQGSESCLERLRPFVDGMIERLASTRFREDPIAGRKYSRATSIISSAYKRHGKILERALLEALKDRASFQVWQEDAFKLSHESLKQLRIHDRVEKCLTIDLPYGECERTTLIDVVVFDEREGTLRSYNVKRGNGSYDAGKRRAILGELLRTNMLLRDYGRKAGFEPTVAEARIIFYYGLRSIPEPMSLIGNELDEHFGFHVRESIEAVNSYFTDRLHALIEAE